MQVDFNGLRLNLQRSYNELVEFLEENTNARKDCVEIEPHNIIDLRLYLDSLRKDIVILMCLFTDKTDNISEQVDLKKIDLWDENEDDV